MNFIEQFLTQLPGLLGGGGLVLIAEVLRKMYTTRVREREHQASLSETRSAREADDSRSFVLEANSERRATLDKVERQAQQITQLSVAVARCEEKHAANELREAEKDEEIRRLSTALDMTQQLVSKQRAENEMQKETIVRQGRDIEGLHSQLDALRAQFDTFVKQQLGVNSISQIPGGG